MPNDNPNNLPAIAPKSPLAEGGTINVRNVGDQTQLRIWVAGTPVENSMHKNVNSAMRRIVKVVLQYMGGGNAIGALFSIFSGAEDDDN